MRLTETWLYFPSCDFRSPSSFTLTLKRNDHLSQNRTHDYRHKGFRLPFPQNKLLQLSLGNSGSKLIWKFMNIMANFLQGEMWFVSLCSFQALERVEILETRQFFEVRMGGGLISASKNICWRFRLQPTRPSYSSSSGTSI